MTVSAIEGLGISGILSFKAFKMVRQFSKVGRHKRQKYRQNRNKSLTERKRAHIKWNK